MTEKSSETPKETGAAVPPPAANPLTTLATLAGEFVQASEAAAVGVFEAELAAMNALLKPASALDAEAREAKARQDEAEIEAGFDNLPV